MENNLFIVALKVWFDFILFHLFTLLWWQNSDFFFVFASIKYEISRARQKFFNKIYCNGYNLWFESFRFITSQRDLWGQRTNNIHLWKMIMRCTSTMTQSLSQYVFRLWTIYSLLESLSNFSSLADDSIVILRLHVLLYPPFPLTRVEMSYCGFHMYYRRRTHAPGRARFA